MDICKKCGGYEFYEVKKANNLCVYCKMCDSWITNKKHDFSGKNKEDYKNEYLEKQPPTDKQIWFLRNKIKYKGEIKNKFHASELISKYK